VLGAEGSVLGAIDAVLGAKGSVLGAKESVLGVEKSVLVGGSHACWWVGRVLVGAGGAVSRAQMRCWEPSGVCWGPRSILLTGQHRPCKQGRCQTDRRCVGKGVGPRDQCRRYGRWSPHLAGATSEFEVHFPVPALDPRFSGGGPTLPWKVGLYLSTLAMVETRHALGPAPGATVKRTFLLFGFERGKTV
jgi:hypothetical protein